MKRRSPSLVLLGAVLLAFPCSMAFAATIVVNSTADTTANDGVCTLREAIIAANTNTASGALAGECVAGAPGLDTINFAIIGAGVHTIAPASTFPSITEAVLIDGYSQPGASPNSLPVGNNAVLLIEISGAVLPGFADVFHFLGGGGSTVRGLVVNRVAGTSFSIGFSINSDSNTIAGNYIGTDPTGTAFLSGTQTAVRVSGSSNTIGGTTPAARNVIAASGGVNAGTILMFFGGGNLIQGNYLGVNAAGTAALQPPGATDGIEMMISTNNTIGGTAAGARNVILATAIGIRLSSGANGNLIQGNFIGTNAAGTAGLGGGVGISTDNAPANTTVGGAASGAGNLISGGSNGIQLGDAATGTIVRGNKIGTDVTGTLPIPNSGIGILASDTSAGSVIGGTNPGESNSIAFNGGTGVVISAGTGWGILRNSIFSNGGLGIDLGNNGVTPNDPCDADTGANNLQNFPVLTTGLTTGGNTNIQGTLNSAASTTYRIEFFANDTCDPSGFGEGQTYLGFTNVTTDPSCNASFNVTLPISVAPTTRLTATATDPANNTSEFSSCISLQAQFHTIQPCRLADTRNPPGPYGGPALDTITDRSFVVAGQCNIPATAQAVAFNFAIVLPTGGGHISVYPGAGILPVSATMNYSAGQIRANNAVVPLGPAGDILVHLGQSAGTTAHIVIDVNGYFE